MCAERTQFSVDVNHSNFSTSVVVLVEWLARFTVELQTRRDVLSFSRGERGEPRLRGRAGTAG